MMTLLTPGVKNLSSRFEMKKNSRRHELCESEYLYAMSDVSSPWPCSAAHCPSLLLAVNVTARVIN